MLLRAALAQSRHGTLDEPTAEALSLPGGDTALPWGEFAPGMDVRHATGMPGTRAAGASSPQRAAAPRPLAAASRVPD